MASEPVHLWEAHENALRMKRGDFRGSFWGATAAEVKAAEPEAVDDTGRCVATIFRQTAQVRYVFGSKGLRGAACDFILPDDPNSAFSAFNHCLKSLVRAHGLPLYLQRARSELDAHADLPPTSLLRSMAHGAMRCTAAWATSTSEILLILDKTTVPMRLVYQARDQQLYPSASSTTGLIPIALPLTSP